MNIIQNGAVSSDEINTLIYLCWDQHEEMDFENILKHNLAHFIVRDEGERLIAYCNLAWDGGRHATVFDLNVHPDHRHKGIALEILKKAKLVAQDNKIQFFHVDFDESLKPLYQKAGFEMISAGLICL